jgi:hypothetical protein
LFQKQSELKVNEKNEKVLQLLAGPREVNGIVLLIQASLEGFYYYRNYL